MKTFEQYYKEKEKKKLKSKKIKLKSLIICSDTCYLKLILLNKLLWVNLKEKNILKKNSWKTANSMNL